jgi:soluble lytic murein transglycosylase-like protein
MEVGQKYGLSPHLLYAMARTESGLNPLAIHRGNADGSYDIGLMQINSAWLPRLRAIGISEEQLLDACTNLDVGAWILAQDMRRLGASWDAVGAYNAASPERRLRYEESVARHLPPELQR